MLTLANLSVTDRKTTVVENLQAVFADGFIYGIYAPSVAALQPLMECIGGQRSSYKGRITYNDGGVEGLAGYTDCRILGAVAARKKLLPEAPVATVTAGTFPSYSLPEYEDFLSGPMPAGSIDFSKKILLLHHLGVIQSAACRDLLSFLKRHTASSQKTVIITSQEYAALRDICDYIFLFDKKRFPIVVEKADFALFDEYFEMVFRR